MSITLPSIISSGMVIERRARIWGMSTENGVTVVFNGREYTAPVNSGRWEVTVVSDTMGGPYNMRIGDIILEEVYVGYVFTLSGQSNMEMPVSRVRLKYDEDFESVNNPRIRAFQVERSYYFDYPREDCVGAWRPANDNTINSFYAVPWYYAEVMERELDAPIGIIECAVGGSRIETWMSEESVCSTGYAAELLSIAKYPGFIDSVIDYDLKMAGEWLSEVRINDKGLNEGYYLDDYNHDSWPRRPLTKDWDGDIGFYHGSVWFRKTITLPRDMIGQYGKLWLGRITDSDTVYINGEIVGKTEYKYPPRCYPVREGLLREGENSIAVRLLSERDKGGFCEGKDYKLETASGVIPLDDEWAYMLAYKTAPLPLSLNVFRLPCCLYNGMLAPILPYSISAFLWYQGESNDQSPRDYAWLLSRFLKDIRNSCGENLPFLLVQLPNFDAGELNDSWAQIRKHQKTILQHPNTAMIITTDIGEDNDLHPLNKRDVGRRLAFEALKLLNKNNH